MKKCKHDIVFWKPGTAANDEYREGKCSKCGLRVYKYDMFPAIFDLKTKKQVK